MPEQEEEKKKKEDKKKKKSDEEEEEEEEEEDIGDIVDDLVDKGVGKVPEEFRQKGGE